jgi:hypothetical protein
VSFFNQPLKTILGTASMLTMLSFSTPVVAAPTEDVTGGSTRVQLSREFVSALASLKVLPGVVGDSDLTGQGIVIFPISGGEFDLGSVKNEIIHLGGLSLKSSTTTVELTDFIITTLGESPVLTGLLTVDDNLATRAPLFALALPPVTPPLQPVKDRILLENVGVTLTAEGAAVLNDAFGVTAFTAGLNIGTARVNAVVSSH